MNYGYVINVNVIIMHTNFQMKLQVLLKVVHYNSFPNCPNELKLTDCSKGSVRIIPTKFEAIPRKLF